jgi:RNA polymerase sigma-70 factor (ECF subfamily)
VARLLVGLTRHSADLGLVLRPTEVNGQPGAVVVAPDGGLVYALSLEIADGVVQTVRSVRNPDKLRHLGPVADHRALLRERAERQA